MSKVVKGVGRSVEKIVKGTFNTFKKVVTSKTFKTIQRAVLIAGAVYFGGAALMGGASSAAAGGGFLKGASAGLSSAATGVSTAWSSLAAGNISAAGSSLASGFTGASTAGASAAGASAIAPAAPIAVPTTAPMVGADPFSGVTSTGLPTVADDAANVLAAPPNKVLAAPPSKGLVGNFLGGLSPQGQASSIMVGGQLTGGLIQGYGMRQEQKRQEELAGEARARYNTNVGSRVWA